jgi:hypothetical protein
MGKSQGKRLEELGEIEDFLLTVSQLSSCRLH